jgi:hypothetical protein
MSEGVGSTPEHEREQKPADEAIRGRGDEGARSAQVTPPIADDAEHGQTQAPAPPDDVGVPSDEQLSKEGAGDGD